MVLEPGHDAASGELVIHDSAPLLAQEVAVSPTQQHRPLHLGPCSPGTGITVDDPAKGRML